MAIPGEISGRGHVSAVNDLWRRISFWNQAHTLANGTSLEREFDEGACSPELRGLVGTLGTIRRRILANTLLRGWTLWLVWTMFGLVAVAVVSVKLTGALILVAVLATAGGAGILIWARATRPSHYEAARRLDSVARLQDRVSTAIYLGDIKNPERMIAQQRRDALARMAIVDPRGFFPVRLPANVGRAFVLVLMVAGLFAYRIHHKPPLTSLLQTTARSQLVQSIFSPVVHAMEKDLQRTMALVTMKPDATGEETRRGDAASADDLWRASDDRGAGAEDQKDSAVAGATGQPQDQLQAPDSQESSPTGEARREESESQASEGKSGNESTSGQSQLQSEQQAPDGRQSLGQSILHALRNMLSNSPDQQAGNRANQQPPNGQGTPQSGNSQQPGSKESDKRGESRGSSDTKQKATQTASEGAGSQPGNKELRKDQEMHPINGVPDRVALEASGFKNQTRMKIATETGAAQLSERKESPQTDPVINGAEQENIPARYRFYVQRYFEHADNGNH